MTIKHEEVLDERGAAAYLNLSPRTLQQWRYLGRGPRYVRVSMRCIRYRVRDLDDWMASRLVDTNPNTNA